MIQFEISLEAFLKRTTREEGRVVPSKEAMISEEYCEVTPRDLDQKLKSWSRISIVLSHIGVYAIFLKKGFFEGARGNLVGVEV